MEVIVMEAEAYKKLLNKLDRMMETLDSLVSEKRVDDKYLTILEASAYVGFGKSWLSERKAGIGYYQDGKDLRFKKENLDSYMAKHFIKKKHH